MNEERFFIVKVCGLAATLNNGEVKIKVNVPPEQERYWNFIGEKPRSDVKFIKCPSGIVKKDDFSLFQALERETKEHTDGCLIYPIDVLSIPFSNFDREPAQLLFWVPIILIGNPKPTATCQEHIWISREEFEGNKIRYSGCLDKNEPEARIIRIGFDFFENRKIYPEYFSYPSGSFWVFSLRYQNEAVSYSGGNIILQAPDIHIAEQMARAIIRMKGKCYLLNKKRRGPFSTLEEARQFQD